MRINELINETESLQERSYQHSRIMYHGTTSEFLRSILKTGLQPQPGQKSWTGPEGANLESLDGVYFAPDIRISARAARAAAEKHGGKPMMIAAQVVTDSGTPDEDLIFHSAMRNAFLSLKDGRPQDAWTQTQADLKWAIKPTQQTQVKMGEFIKQAQDIIQRDGLLTQANPVDIEGYLLKQQELKDLMPGVLATMRMNTDPRLDPSNHQVGNARILRPVAFRGKTRIIKIWEIPPRGFDPRDSSRPRGEVYYTDPTQPFEIANNWI